MGQAGLVLVTIFDRAALVGWRFLRASARTAIPPPLIIRSIVLCCVRVPAIATKDCWSLFMKEQLSPRLVGFAERRSLASLRALRVFLLFRPPAFHVVADVYS